MAQPALALGGVSRARLLAPRVYTLPDEIWPGAMYPYPSQCIWVTPSCAEPRGQFGRGDILSPSKVSSLLEEKTSPKLPQDLYKPH